MKLETPNVLSETVDDLPVQGARRDSSMIARASRDGTPVYVKRYLEGDELRTTEVIRRRTAREADVLYRLSVFHEMRGRLGVMKVLESDPKLAQLVLAEAPGQPLHDLLLAVHRLSVNRKALLKPLFLAGRWLRVFQSLPSTNEDATRFNDEPLDLAEYCERRVQKIHKRSAWPDISRCGDVVSLVRKLMRDAADSGKELVWCHGDYGPGNMVWDGCVLTPIDFAKCRLDLPLLDVTYFIHRLEMLPLQFPWRSWPIARWSAAFLRGYGRPDVLRSPVYQALMVRHLLCRIQSLGNRPAKNWRQSLHNTWLLLRLRARLRSLVRRHSAES